jgi:hypothetical protein
MKAVESARKSRISGAEDKHIAKHKSIKNKKEFWVCVWLSIEK